MYLKCISGSIPNEKCCKNEIKCLKKKDMKIYFRCKECIPSFSKCDHMQEENFQSQETRPFLLNSTMKCLCYSKIVLQFKEKHLETV